MSENIKNLNYSRLTSKVSRKRQFYRIFLVATSILLFSTLALINNGQSSDSVCEVISSPGGAWRIQADSSVKSSLRVGDILRAKDRIEIARGSSIEIAFDKERLNILHIEGETSMQVAELFPTSIELSKGKVFALLNNKNSDRRFKLMTPTAIAAVRGTEFQASYSAELGSQIATYTGLVQVSGRNPNTGYETKDFILLRANQKTSVKSEGQIGEPQPLTDNENFEISAVQSKVTAAKAQLTAASPIVGTGATAAAAPKEAPKTQIEQPKREASKLIQSKSEETDSGTKNGNKVLL